MGKYKPKKTHRHAILNLRRQWVTFTKPHARRFTEARVSFRLFHSDAEVFENPQLLDRRSQPVVLVDNDIESDPETIEAGIHKVLAFAKASAQLVRRHARVHVHRALRSTAPSQKPRTPPPGP